MRIAFIVLAAILAASCGDAIVAPTPVVQVPHQDPTFPAPESPVLVCITAPCPPLPPVSQ